ncbi:hypothetical protein [Myroides odoratimimus]|uniref:hypothetical protein n=1 Tax=Myroides odoratimimus TaxID=76832 RepID=UPI001CE17E88|nr:hypothetical protein [Myroides odoratimimus]MCA4806975.1 hypothetical protein [Myroides odoratimimus]
MRKKVFLVLLSCTCLTIGYGQEQPSAHAGQAIGVNTVLPTKALDVNGEVRIREVNTISGKGELFPLFVNKDGVVGTSVVNREVYTTFLRGQYTEVSAVDYNMGRYVVFPMKDADVVLNTTSNYMTPKGFRIEMSGIYSLAASSQIGFTALEDPGKDPYLFMAFQVQISNNEGESWQPLIGYRYIGPRLAVGYERSHNLVLPSNVVNLEKGNLLRLVIFRTKFNTGEVQGVGASKIFISSSYSGSPYTLSITKL